MNLRKHPKDFTKKIKFNTQTVSDGHHQVSYRGIKAIRNPFDYVIYQMIISEIKPDLIIEIGTNAGGGALYMANLMDSMDHGIIHTIDINEMIDDIPRSHPRIKYFLGGWQAYDIEQAKYFEKILIIEDSSHMYEDIIKVLHKFEKLVNVGSYFIVEDGIVDALGIQKQYNGGPQKAIIEFLNNSNDYIIDRKWCDFFGINATFNVNGYLKRVK